MCRALCRNQYKELQILILKLNKLSHFGVKIARRYRV
ncbi:unnamed protein product [Tetraodon nigroviridis]|uniref:(spotted green pufferfish) hypothetical protein n=1 Tax=Tetraodon nigroviridis TaxID=99883 RepID=Q4T0M1_TETNG|nr:unnamed protein product [Tetraodon nigroviridis]